MGKLTQLLRWKRVITLNDENGKALRDGDGNPVTVWIRIIGDESLQTAYKLARIKSGKRRDSLRNQESMEYQDEVLPILEADKETCMQLIELSVENNFMSEAISNVEREELPKLEEIAIDADAPTLEEQEKLDAMVVKQEEDYQKAIDEYVETRKAELKVTLKDKTLDELRVQATFETSNALALATFLIEVQNQKVYRSVFLDKECKIPAFDDVDEFADLPPHNKKQLIEAYQELEMSPDDVKN